MNELFQSPWQHRLLELLGWTVVHFLWQGLALLGPLALSLWLLRRHAAATRYYAACGGLVALSLCPAVTLLLLVKQSDPESWRTPSSFLESGQTLAHSALSKFAAAQPSLLLPMPPDAASDFETRLKATPAEWLGTALSNGAGREPASRWMALIAAVWLLGVVLLSARLLGGLWRVHGLRRRAGEVENSRIRQSFERVLARMNVRRPIDLLASAEMAVPGVIGFWRPALIVPASLLSGLAPAEVESILAHELAHVRRHDWLVNLLQSFLETLLFFHPVVWWLSNVIRRERENCCDDLAVQAVGDRLVLAKALLRLEEGRCSQGLALSATGGALIGRIRRLVAPHEHHSAPRWPAGLLTLSVVLMLLSGWWVSVLAGASTTSQSDQSAERLVQGAVERLSRDAGLRLPVVPDLERAEQEPSQESFDSPKISVLERDSRGLILAELRSRETGHSPKRRLATRLRENAKLSPESSRRVTDQELLVSSPRVEYVLGGNEATGMDAAEITLHLPDDSGFRTEFSGEEVSLASRGCVTVVKLLTGRVTMIDPQGVVRVTASADNGAEQLLATVSRSEGEFLVRLQAAFVDPDQHRFTPVVQARLNLLTGAPADEAEPPHGAVRYRIDHDPQTRSAPMSLKIERCYDPVRLLQEEAERAGGFQPDSGSSAESWRADPIRQPADAGLQREEPAEDEREWGPVASATGLQMRLSLQTTSPRVGSPVLLKLELRNSSQQPTEFDPQEFAPFRILRVDLPRPELPPPFIGLRPQTSGERATLQPGEVRTLWERVDLGELFLLGESRDYEVFAEGKEWAASAFLQDSNHFQLKLGPGGLAPREQLLVNLQKIKPEDWKLSVGPGEIYLQHSPSNLKSDVTSIAIRFQPEKLAADFEVGWPVPGEERVFARAQVDYLGETVLGQVYVLSLPAATRERWPTYLEEITRAVKSLPPASGSR